MATAGKATVVNVVEPLPGVTELENASAEAPPWSMTLESGEKCVFRQRCDQCRRLAVSQLLLRMAG